MTGRGEEGWGEMGGREKNKKGGGGVERAGKDWGWVRRAGES